MINVLFICVHNSGRSQMAEAFTNLYSAGTVYGMSAGTAVSETLNPVVVEVMNELGIDMSANRPKALSSEMIERADHIYTMGCALDEACPVAFVPSEDWGLTDPAAQPIETVRLIRDDIERRVRDLISRHEEA